jgi:hypothetical protein
MILANEENEIAVMETTKGFSAKFYKLTREK